MTTAAMPTGDGEPLSQVTPGDVRRAASMLASALTGDRWGITAEVAVAQRVDRVGVTVQAVAALLLYVAPELRKTAMVDRLRGLASNPATVPNKPVARPKNNHRSVSKPLPDGPTERYHDWLSSLSD